MCSALYYLICMRELMEYLPGQRISFAAWRIWQLVGSSLVRSARNLAYCNVRTTDVKTSLEVYALEGCWVLKSQFGFGSWA